jgi:uncharacterized protein (DUF2267 family)
VDLRRGTIIDGLDEAREWLDQLAGELGTDDRAYVYRVLRAHLQTVRDRLPVEDALALSGSMPELIRSIYVEGWRPGRPTRRRLARAGFHERFRAGDDTDTGDLDAACAAAGRVLASRADEASLRPRLAELAGEPALALSH